MKTLVGFGLLALSMGNAQVTIQPPEGPVPVLAVVGGETLPLQVAVEAAPGTEVKLTYDLVQLAEGLAAPLVTGQSLGSPVVLDQTSRRVVAVNIPVPEVTRPTRMLVKIVSSASPGDSGGPNQNQVFLEVYPKPEPGHLARVLAGAEEASGLRLAVFGECPALRKFFQEEQIAFLDLGSEAADLGQKAILPVGEAGLEDGQDLKSRAARMVLFVRDPTAWPGVYRTDSPDGSLVRVTLPLLDTLSTNPRSRQIFLDILLQTFPTKPTIP